MSDQKDPPKVLQNGEAIRSLREKDGLSQVALAGFVGITSQHMCRIESEERGASPAVLNKIARALCVRTAAVYRDLEQAA